MHANGKVDLPHYVLKHTVRRADRFAACAIELTQQVPPFPDAAGCHELQRYNWPAGHEAAQRAEEGPASMHCIELLCVCSAELTHVHVAAAANARHSSTQQGSKTIMQGARRLHPLHVMHDMMGFLARALAGTHLKACACEPRIVRDCCQGVHLLLPCICCLYASPDGEAAGCYCVDDFPHMLGSIWLYECQRPACRTAVTASNPKSMHAAQAVHAGHALHDLLIEGPLCTELTKQHG